VSDFYNQEKDAALEELNTCRDGLESAEALKRRQKFGANALTEGREETPLQVFLRQFKDFLVVILLAAAVISAISGQLESTIVILAVLVLNAVLGTVQHFQAEKSLKSLKALSAPVAKVLRGGQAIEVRAADVTIGDVVLLEAGDMVVADGRIIENFSLQVNESSLTGESVSVQKTAEVIEGHDLPLGDRQNMVYSGSLATYGRAFAVVTAIGMQTELGKIAALMNQTQRKLTPLQVNLDNFGKKLAVFIMAICALVLFLGIWRGEPILDALLFAVALAVAAIPEALTSIVTIVLAAGTQKMARANAIVKELKAAEALGAVSVICSDKTGTLTQNKMTAQKIYVDGRVMEIGEMSLDSSLQACLLDAAVLNCDATVHDDKSIGDPTEVALVNLGRQLDIKENEHRAVYPRLSELAFDSDRKMMSVLHKVRDQNIMYTKGALDSLLPRMPHIMTAEGIRPLTVQDGKAISDANEVFSRNGLRVLAFAQREMTQAGELDMADEDNLTFIGLVALMDPPRPESIKAVADALQAGIKTVMITGDHKTTAAAIARQIGILSDEDIVLDGQELNRLSDDELALKIDHIAVYARVSPEHKIRIVDAWQKRGRIVAMTGDGVNDAPALKKADVGVAMGVTGTEVSKDAAAFILADDNFATIVKAVESGRNIYNNIQNSICFLLSGNTAAILGVLYASVAALPMPFAAVQLLFINLLTDSLPAIAIGMEKSRSDLLRQKPRDPKKSILSKDLMSGILAQGALMGIFVMWAFYLGLEQSKEMAMTMAFATLTLARLFHGFNCRGKASIFRLGLFSNKYSWMAFGVGLALLSAVLFIPGLQRLFYAEPINFEQIWQIAALAFAPTAIIQIYKGLLTKIIN
jgi:Ca2+-transporting ATPase